MRQYQGVGCKQTVPVLLSDLEMQRLTAAAARVGVDLALSLRAAALNAATETIHDHRPTYTREQLMSIHRVAQNKGHVWTEAELRDRGLPLYWCEAWVTARLAVGATRVQLAVESGHPERALTHYVRNVHDQGKFKVLTASQQDVVREQVAGGNSRDQVAAETSFSVNTVATYARSLPGVQERQFREVVGQVQKWPAPRVRVAEVAFDGNGPAASAWLRAKVQRGWLDRVRRGWYDHTEGAPLTPIQVGAGVKRESGGR